MHVMSWRPKKRHIVYEERPPEIPEAVYVEALAAKRFYNEDWEFWVWAEARDASATQGRDVSQAEAEEACIRGLKKALNRISFVYGEDIAKWYEKFLDMGDIFDKVKHPEYEKRLGY